jgi:hypothetical protein
MPPLGGAPQLNALVRRLPHPNIAHAIGRSFNYRIFSQIRSFVSPGTNRPSAPAWGNLPGTIRANNPLYCGKRIDSYQKAFKSAPLFDHLVGDREHIG